MGPNPAGVELAGRAFSLCSSLIGSALSESLAAYEFLPGSIPAKPFQIQEAVNIPWTSPQGRCAYATGSLASGAGADVTLLFRE
jgi:hypothetical protein